MTYANSAERQALICGLRGLADFLESNPDVPAPTYIDVLVFPPSASDVEGGTGASGSIRSTGT